MILALIWTIEAIVSYRHLHDTRHQTPEKFGGLQRDSNPFSMRGRCKDHFSLSLSFEDSPFATFFSTYLVDNRNKNIKCFFPFKTPFKKIGSFLSQYRETNTHTPIQKTNSLMSVILLIKGGQLRLNSRALTFYRRH